MNSVRTLKSLLCLSLLAVSASAFAAHERIGISLPTQNDPRLYKEGPELKAALEAAGFDVYLYYGGDNDIPIQKWQMQRMVKENRCRIMIVDPIDDGALSEELKTAEQAGVPVIAYDRLIRKSSAVKYYIGFDNAATGRMQIESIFDATNLGMRKEGDPVYLELFAGSPVDNSARMYWSGMEEQLTRYTYSEEAQIPSGQQTFEECTTVNWNADLAQKRMDQLISSQGYGPSGKKLHAVYSQSDSLTNGIIKALKRVGYTAENMPFITGNDATLAALRGIANGERGSTVYRDPKVLHEAVVKMVSSIIKGEEPETNNVAYDEDNEIPAYYCEPKLVTKRNLEEVFVKSGMYRKDEIFR